jgi:hypothetical protein
VRWSALSGTLALVLAVAIAVGPAGAAPIPAATYSGRASDGAGVTFTVSSDGTLVQSYQLQGVFGDHCQFLAAGAFGVWPGAPIVGGAFHYQLGYAIQFQGTFPGAQTAAGSFHLHQKAVGSNAPCDSGTVSWTATTTASPPAGSGGRGGTTGGGGSGGSGTGAGGGGPMPAFATSITLRKSSKMRETGRITSPNGACRASRSVMLWRGRRRIASTKTKANGTFWFKRSAAVRGRAIRASSPARKVRAGYCDAGSSTFIKG